MNILKKIGELLGDVGEWLLGIGDDTIEFAKGLLITLANNPEIQALASEAVKIVEEAAIAAVTGDKVSGSAKLAQAQEIVVSGLKEKGLPVVMNAINIAIEAAVANMKAEK